MSTRKRTPKPERPIRWSAQTFVVSGFTRGPRMLGVVVDPSSCAVLAFEGPVPLTGAPEESALAAFFGDHAHALVHNGEGLTFADAITVAEIYGRKWKAEGVEHDPCNCPDLGEAATA
jgi:hypothetical protein